MILIALALFCVGIPSVRADITSPTPTPDHPFGWRGDGSGRYPTANPPTTWERRMITPLTEVRSFAGKPIDPAVQGEPLKRAKGTFQPLEWLVLAPIPGQTDENKSLQEPIIANEATLAPAAGDHLRGLTWKAIRNTRGIDFFAALGTLEGTHVALLYASIYSPSEAEFGFQCGGNHGAWALFLNGKSENGWEQARHPLHAGWNQLLLKVVLRNRESDSRVEPQLYPFPGPHLSYATKNIPWVRTMPGPSFAMPLMVGDKLFVTSEPNDLICLDKTSGKVLWMRSDTLWHAVIGTEPTVVHLKIISVSPQTLTLVSDAPLDPAAAGAYQISGATLLKAEVSPHGSTIRLTCADHWPWKEGDDATISWVLKTASGKPADGTIQFVYQPGRILGDGSIHELLFGPIRTGSDPGKTMHAGPDEGIDEELRPRGDWKRSASVDGIFNLNTICGEHQNCVAPAIVHLFSARDQAARLLISSDDGIRVHLNGKFVFASPNGRWFGAGPEKIGPVALHRGWNVLRLDVIQGSGDWAVSISVMDETGQKPAAEVTYQANPPGEPDPAVVEDQSPLEQLRPMAEKLERMNADYVADGGDEKLHDLRRKLAQELTDHVKKIDRAYGVSLGWGGGNSTATPCSDGKFVYVWRGETGVLSCYDVNGNPRWRRFQHTGDDAEHGFNSSPIIAGDVIGLIGGARVFGFDRATGRTLWRQRYPHPCYASLVAAKIEGQDVFVTPVGMILRAADGKVLQKAFGLYDGECASAALDGDNFYIVARGGFCAAQLPRSLAPDPGDSMRGRLAPEAIQDSETYPVGSPLCDGGLVYFTHSGWSGHQWPILFVVDPAKPAIVYSQRLDLTPEIHYAPDGAGVAASLALGGKNLYVMANRGETIVFKTGTRYEQIAKNTIESIGHDGRQEITESTPIFDGGRMYYRGEYNLYCIGMK